MKTNIVLQNKTENYDSLSRSVETVRIQQL